MSKTAIDTELLDFLSSRGIGYEVHEHPIAFTALETAAADHTSGKLFAKTVVFWQGDKLSMAVLPAHLRVGSRQTSQHLW